MRRLFRTILLGVLLCAIAVVGYGWLGFRDARSQSEELQARADGLIGSGRGGIGLGSVYREALLAVEDPAFTQHYGFDLTTPGAGSTTITESLAKRVCFDDFQPGIAKIRQTGCAIGLETVLSKRQIMALFLDTVEMGPGPDGRWVRGLFAASEAHFGSAPMELSQEEFASLVAVMIAPGELDLTGPSPKLEERIARILRLVADECLPTRRSDVWLEGCSSGSATADEGAN